MAAPTLMLPSYSAMPEGATFIEYTHIVPSPVHIARMIGDKLGVRVTDTQPDCVVDQDIVARYASAWKDLPRPWVVATRRASRFMPNKDWPDRSWARAVQRYETASILSSCLMPARPAR